jgi:hypothetical protein
MIIAARKKSFDLEERNKKLADAVEGRTKPDPPAKVVRGRQLS